MQSAIRVDFPLEQSFRVQPDTTLFWEGDDAAAVYELRSGVVRAVTINENGDRQIIAFFFAGDQIGLPISTGYRYSAEAVTPVSYQMISRRRWLEHLADSCRSEGMMPDAIGAEQDALSRRGMLLGRQGALARLAEFLCGMLDRLAVTGQGYALPIPQVDMACYLGMSPETVCRMLRRLRETGIIDMPVHDRFLLINHDALAQMAQETGVSRAA